MSLRFFYKNSASDLRGYLFIAKAEDYELFLNDGCQVLPPLNQDSAKKFIKKYNLIIKKYINLNRSHKFFAMTPFSLRNTWQSSFYHGFESSARLKNLYEGDVYFNSPEWFLWAVEHFGASVTTSDVERARTDLKNLCFYKFYMAWQGLRFLWSKKASKRIIDRADFYIATINVQNSAEKWRNGQDVFFGDLPKLLNEKGRSCAFIYHAEKADHANSSGPIPAFNVLSLIGFKEWIYIFKELLSFKMFTSSDENFPVETIKRDICESLSNQIPLALTSYFSTKKIIQKNPDAHFLSLYENNCWEQGVLLAAEEGQAKVTGFQHTAFSPSYLKMGNHIDDKKLPDRIFSTGIESANILKNFMGHKHVEVGCALRYKPSSLLQNHNEKDKILVLLQGAPDDVLFLQTIRRYIGEKNVLVRVHPNWPLKQVFSFELSHADLKEDLARASVVLYTGTTAAFEALSAGVPAIHVDLGGALSADPLFTLDDCAVKRKWSQGDDFSAIIGEISMLSPTEKAAEFEKAQNYISNYFSPADEAALEKLIEKVVHIG